MQLSISRRHIEQLIEYARGAHPSECCGLLLGHGDRVEAIKLAENQSPTPHHQFEIDPAALFWAQKQERAGGAGVIGYFHSHPNGQPEPSKTDAEMAAPDGRSWLIIAKNEVTGWRAVDNGALYGRFAPIILIS